MRILMLNNEFPPLGGGTGTVNLELFKMLRQHKHINIDLITSAAGKGKHIRNFSENIRIIELPVKKKNIHHASNPELIRYALKSTFEAFRQNKKTPYDFVFVWTTVPSGFPALLLKIFRKKPYIIRIGGPDIPGFEARYSTVYKIITPLIKLIWKKSCQIVVKCQTEADMVAALNPQVSIMTIYNGVDIDTYKPKEYNTVNKPLKIICTGRLIKRKGQYTLIDAVAGLKEEENISLQVDLVGEGDETQKYKDYAKEKNLTNEIVFSGYIRREEMPKKYREADLFVLPSYNEGMSNALLEAMASGLPAIVTDVGGTQELVNNENGAIFKAGDANRLKTILLELCQNKNKIQQMGENARKKALQFDKRKVAEAYLNLFSDICTEQKKHSE